MATNEEHTHSCLGVRAARVVAHGPAPRGFLVHGGEATLWTAYVHRGVVPRGADFVRAVKELAERANVWIPRRSSARSPATAKPSSFKRSTRSAGASS